MHCLIIGKVWPEPNSTAAGKRTVDIIQALLAAGYRVTFAASGQPNEYSVDLKCPDLSTHSIRPNDSGFDSWLLKLAPDVVLFDRFMIEEQFGWRVEKACPAALRILDTSDLHCLREARRLRVESGQTFNIYNEIALREVAAILRCDLTLIIADYEMRLLREKFDVPESQIAYLPFWLDLSKAEFTPAGSRQNFMMIGNFMHAPNVDGFRWCKQAVWPLIREKLPQAELHCYGAYGDPYKAEFHAPKDGIVYKGRAENVLITMQKYRVNCAPLRYGAGLKGKLFDGFQTGTPTVTTPVGAEGVIGNENWGCTVSSDPEKFAQTAIELYTNDKLWRKVQTQGYYIVRKRFSSNVWLARLPRLIKTRLAQVDKDRARHFVGRMLRHHQHRSTEYMSRWIEAKNQNNNG